MRKLVVVLAILVIAAPVYAGTWDANKTWTSALNPTTLKGFGWGLDGTTPYETWGNYQPQTGDPMIIKDRTGTRDALVLRNNNAANSQNKYRSDTNTAGWTYDNTKNTCILIGAYMLDATSSYPQIYIRTAAGSVKIRYSDSNQRWIPADSATQVNPASPSFLAVPLKSWHTIRFQLNTDKSWHAWLNEDPTQHMWGTYTGTSTGSYIQFGALGSTTDRSDWAVDYVAWGQGTSIGDMVVPEPSSLAALCTGLFGFSALIRRRR